MKGTATQTSRFGTLAALQTTLHFPTELYDKNWDVVSYPVDWLPLAASAQNQPRSVQIDSQADFAICGGVYTASDPATELTFFLPAAVSLQILMPGNKSIIGQVGNNQGSTHINNLLGTRGVGNDGKWPVAYPVPRNGTITLTATNLGATAYQLRVVLFGFYIY